MIPTQADGSIRVRMRGQALSVLDLVNLFLTIAFGVAAGIWLFVYTFSKYVERGLDGLV